MNTLSQIVEDKKKQFLIVSSIAFAAYMSTLDMYIVNISLPTIAADFGVGTSKVSWVTLSYLLITVSTLLLFGKLNDKYGLKNIFILGYTVFTVGSLMCGLSPSLSILVGARFVQGIGASMISTVAFAAIPKYIPVNRRGWAFGILATAAALGTTTGAPMGGFITAYLTWHWIFLINVPVGILAVLAVIKIFPKPLPASERETKARFDITGAALSFITFLALIYALNQGAEEGWTSPVILFSFATFIIALPVFILWERKTKDPMLHLSLLKNRNFSFANTASLTGCILLGGSNFLLPFYLMLVKGVRSNVAGMIVMIYSLTFMSLTGFAGRLADRIKPRVLCTTGMAIGALASGTFAFALNKPGMLHTYIFLVLAGICYALFITPNSTQIMNLAPTDKQGVASGILTVMKTLGVILGVSIFETIFSHFAPHALDSTSQGSVHATIPTELLITGFQRAYIVGIIACVLAATASFFVRIEPQK
jgi:EmrB/QacA subfamily drug resistance transporter